MKLEAIDIWVLEEEGEVFVVGVYIGSDNRAQTVVEGLSHHHALCISCTELATWGPRDILHQLTFVLAVSNTSTMSCLVAWDIKCQKVGVGWEFTRSACCSDSESSILLIVCQEVLYKKVA